MESNVRLFIDVYNILIYFTIIVIQIIQVLKNGGFQSMAGTPMTMESLKISGYH